MNVKIFAFILMIIAIINICLFAFKKIDALVFWVIIAVIGIFAYKVVPRLK